MVTKNLKPEALTNIKVNIGFIWKLCKLLVPDRVPSSAAFSPCHFPWWLAAASLSPSPSCPADLCSPPLEASSSTAPPSVNLS